MNKERLTEIAEWLEAGAPEKNGVTRFGMQLWMDAIDEEGDPQYNRSLLPAIYDGKPLCGTTCCIGGTAAIWYTPKGTPRGAMFHDYFVGGELLDLENEQYIELFYAHSLVEPLETITPAWAARCVRKLIETGEVDWMGTR